MKTNQRNKMLTGKERKVKNKRNYFFPDKQVTVEASDKEEAEKKANKLRSSSNK